MRKVLSCILLGATLLMLLAGCGKTPEMPTREITWDHYGRGKDIPCVTIPGGEYATAEEFRYSFRAASGEGIGSDWGTLTKVTSNEAAPIVNYNVGNDVYLTRYINCTSDQYVTLLADMKQSGFAVYAESNLGEKVQTTNLTYQDCIYTVTYMAETAVIDITVSREQTFSPYLLADNPSTQVQPMDGASTTLSFLPRGKSGSGGVVQLKNGHFLLFDGGNVWDLEKLLIFMEEHTPEGQLPVVDAWFITSADYDYSGWGMGFIGSPADLENMKGLWDPVLAKDRLRVEGIYYNCPNALVQETTLLREKDTIDGVTYYSKSTNSWPGKVVETAKTLMTAAGEQTPLYLPLTGQVYRFSGDVQVEILFSQEQLTHGEYGFEFDHSAAWYQVRAEGNTFLTMGKSTAYVLDKVAKLYGDSYFDGLGVLVTANDGKDMIVAHQDTYAAALVYYDLPDMADLSGEAAQVQEYYAANPQIRCVCYADGLVMYDFATDTVTTQ